MLGGMEQSRCVGHETMARNACGGSKLRGIIGLLAPLGRWGAQALGKRNLHSEGDHQRIRGTIRGDLIIHACSFNSEITSYLGTPKDKDTP